MAVKHLSYKDIPPDQRQKGAAEARARIMAALSNPFLPADQRAYFEDQRRRIDLWEKGQLPEEGLALLSGVVGEVAPWSRSTRSLPS